MAKFGALLTGILTSGAVSAGVRAISNRSSGGGGSGSAAAGTGAPQVDAVSEKKTNAKRIGRAALISTSPAGVLTTAPTGRRKLLGN